MAITRRTEIDKMEIVGADRVLQIREATVVEEDGVEISRSYRRRTHRAGGVDDTGVFVDTDLSTEDAEISGVAKAVWSPAIKNRLHLAGAMDRLAEANDELVNMQSGLVTLTNALQVQQAIIDDPNTLRDDVAQAKARKSQITDNIADMKTKIANTEKRITSIQTVIDSL